MKCLFFRVFETNEHHKKVRTENPRRKLHVGPMLAHVGLFRDRRYYITINGTPPHILQGVRAHISCLRHCGFCINLNDRRHLLGNTSSCEVLSHRITSA